MAKDFLSSGTEAFSTQSPLLDIDMDELIRRAGRIDKPLKILFVQLGFHPDFPDVSALASTYNDGIYYVASFVERFLPTAETDVCQMLWNEDPRHFPLDSFDYVLISALGTHFWSNIAALEAIKEGVSPRCKIIMGGPHACFAPHEALRYADYVVLGEGEIPAVQLVAALETGGDLDDVHNLCYLGDDGSLVINRFARYGAIHNAINPRLLARAPKPLQWATVSMSRGCPYNCSFCYAIRILGRRLRTKEVDDIVRELDGIHQQTGSRRFYITDLNFVTDKDFCRQVAAAVRDRGYRFIAMTRNELADDVDLLLELKEAGFEEYYVGVESEDPDVLRSFNKKYDVSLQTTRLQAFAEHDVTIQAGMIFGLEYQDEEAVRHSAAWCAEARLLQPAFLCLAEYPFQGLLYGSHQDVEDHRIITEVPTFQHYSYVGLFPRHMRPSALQRAMRDAYPVYFERAFEIETRPQRRMRLKNYARSVEPGVRSMDRHIAFLEEIEKPYYTPKGELKEDLLKADFEDRYGELKQWLGKLVNHNAEKQASVA